MWTCLGGGGVHPVRVGGATRGGASSIPISAGLSPPAGQPLSSQPFLATMTRSWLCLPLLLVGALLLGQPAWGAEEEEEQPSWRESEELHVPEESEEQMAPPSAEEEEEGDSQEEGIAPASRGPFGFWEEQDSEEFQRKFAQMERRFMEEKAAYSARPVEDFMKRMAVAHYNKHDWRSRYGNYYKHYESSHMDVEKAQGLIATFEMTLASTNCTKDDVINHEDFGMRYSGPYLESQGCVLLPESEQEKFDCTFTVFLDEKYGGATVIDHDCERVPGRTEGLSEEEEEEEEEAEEVFEPSLEE